MRSSFRLCCTDPLEKKLVQRWYMRPPFAIAAFCFTHSYSSACYCTRVPACNRPRNVGRLLHPNNDAEHAVPANAATR